MRVGTCLLRVFAYLFRRLFIVVVVVVVVAAAAAVVVAVSIAAAAAAACCCCCMDFPTINNTCGYLFKEHTKKKGVDQNDLSGTVLT